MAESLYFYGRQFVEQGWLWQKFGVILHDLTVLWFFKENKVMICWFQLQSLVSYVIDFGIIINKSECILRMRKTVRMVLFFCFLKFDLSSGREQNIKNQRNWYYKNWNDSTVLIFLWQTVCWTRFPMTKIWSHITPCDCFMIFIENKARICWFQLQNLHSFGMLCATTNKNEYKI